MKANLVVHHIGRRGGKMGLFEKLSLTALKRGTQQHSDTQEMIVYPPMAMAASAIGPREIADTPTSDFRPMMVGLGVPDDIAQRVCDLDFSNRDKIYTALSSCFGRLQYMQTAGLFVAELLTRKLNLPYLPARDVTNLDYDGALSIAPILSETEADAARAFLLRRPVINGHTPESGADKVGRYVGHTAEQFPFGSHTTLDVISAPHIIEAVLSDSIIGLATSHLCLAPLACTSDLVVH